MKILIFGVENLRTLHEDYENDSDLDPDSPIKYNWWEREKVVSTFIDTYFNWKLQNNDYESMCEEERETSHSHFTAIRNREWILKENYVKIKQWIQHRVNCNKSFNLIFQIKILFKSSFPVASSLFLIGNFKMMVIRTYVRRRRIGGGGGGGG